MYLSIHLLIYRSIHLCIYLLISTSLSLRVGFFYNVAISSYADRPSEIISILLAAIPNGGVLGSHRQEHAYVTYQVFAEENAQVLRQAWPAWPAWPRRSTTRLFQLMVDSKSTRRGNGLFYVVLLSSG